MYLYETHCHTKYSSACASIGAKELVDLYVKNGYTGVFITDHFLNGNTTVKTGIPYSERVRLFAEGYKKVKKAGEGKLDVFFGFEYSYLGTDVLVYGWDEKALYGLEEIVDMPFSRFCGFAKEQGVLAVQAHPFREAHYIDHIRLYPGVEGVETLNAKREERCNRLAEFYASEYGKITTGGSDLHQTTQPRLAGMEFSSPLTSEKDFIERLRKGEGKIFSQENAYLFASEE